MVEGTIAIPDIPDLGAIVEANSFKESEPFEDGWYKGTILEVRKFEDKSGNERIFESQDQLSRAGDSRNITLQIEVTRASDNRTLNTSYLVNYRPEDLSTETIGQVMAQMEAVKKGGEWGPLFRSFMTLNRLGKLQKVAGVRQLARNGNGGLDLHPLFGKTGYFKLEPDTRNPKYKQISDVRDTAPKKNAF